MIFIIKIIKSSKLLFEYDKPNVMIYNFKGIIIHYIISNYIVLKGTMTHSNGIKECIDYQNFMLRGCSLRNIDFIYGLVCFTG